ncbi:MAG: putative glycoside hydrolase [Tissierellales bacterium]|nr:putative glycoside hydrolase [Tissierellales bacterium]MBN2827542.1 putative glycoside hydrolase [Tissierellales bacterium]
MNKKYYVLLGLLTLLLLVVGCSKGPIDITISESVTSTEQTEQTEQTSSIAPTLSDEELAQMALDKAIKEREEFEAVRKAELGEFYVPLPAIGDERSPIAINAKGLFMTGSTAGKNVDKTNVELYRTYIEAIKANDTKVINRLSPSLSQLNTLEKAIGIAAATEINAFIIDVKDDNGVMTYKSEIEAIENVDANRYTRIKDVEGLITLLDEYEIYTIARIVVFKDRNFAYERPEYSIQLKNGGVWHDYSGTPWVNPFDKHVWDYNLAIAKEAALLGFDEIQYDYVRFPDSAASYNPITDFPGRDGKRKDVAIGEFLEYSKEALQDYGVNLGADVFGMITRSWADSPEDIGQTWLEMAGHVDYMCPMVYPSHYGTGWYGYDVPDAHPYGVVKGAMVEAIEKNSAVKGSGQIRPWIQDFTATWVDGYINYGFNEVRQQILAAKELGIDEYMVWNPSNVYDPKSFIMTEKEKNTTYPIERPDYDLVGRTPADAMTEYFKNEKNNRLSKVFLLTPVDDRTDDFEAFYDEMMGDSYELISYSVSSYEMISSQEAQVKVSYQYKKTENGSELLIEANDTIWKIIKERNVWKIKRNIE